MATEKEANKAREKHSDFLRKLGAHSILVDKVGRGKKSTFGVIAFCEEEPSGSVPDELEIETGGEKKKVPFAVRVTPTATLE
ncbi:MAG TPA: hypothetical protein VF611_02515 [Pyrinomonadaceae bacterium]|jgi:hypothetical protein